MGEIIIGILLLLLCVVIYFNSDSFPQLNEGELNPGSYPKLVATILGILVLILIIKKTIELVKTKSPLFKQGKASFFNAIWNEYKLVIITAISLGLYILFMNIIGFILSSILFIITVGLVLGPKKKKDIVLISIISIIITFSMYLFFENVLYVRFPDGMLF